jgi:hypothetical protein
VWSGPAINPIAEEERSTLATNSVFAVYLHENKNDAGIYTEL